MTAQTSSGVLLPSRAISRSSKIATAARTSSESPSKTYTSQRRAASSIASRLVKMLEKMSLRYSSGMRSGTAVVRWSCSVGDLWLRVRRTRL